MLKERKVFIKAVPLFYTYKQHISQMDVMNALIKTTYKMESFTSVSDLRPSCVRHADMVNTCTCRREARVTCFRSFLNYP